MQEVLLKFATMVFLILLGYGLKCVGVFQQSDSKIFTKVMLYVTLPAILINTMRGFTLDAGKILLIFLGFLANLLLAYLGKFLGRKQESKVRAMYMLMLSGFSIGSFAAAFIFNLFPAMMLPVVMFDAGNTIMTCGGTYSLALMELQPDAKFSLPALIKNLLHTFIFDVFMGLFLLSLLHIQFPEPVYEIATSVASANTVVVMLMLGTLFEVHLTANARRQVATIVAGRVGGALALSALVFLLLPMSFDTKRIISMLVCTPIGSMGTVFSAKLDCDPDVYGTAASLSIPISIALMFILSVL